MSRDALSATPKHLLIGLTGGIASGKSTAAILFEELGVRIIDTDAISRRLTQPDGAAIAAIGEAFGADYLDASGALNRSKMRERVFANPAEKKRLEAILHPAILNQVTQLIAADTDAPYSIIVIPLLFENQRYRDLIHRTLTVDCPEEIQIARAMQRSGLEQAQVQSIMSQQIARAQRLALTDDIIHNESDLAGLSEQITRLHQRYLALAAGSD